jgi:glycosyltransferase involved in cell wall biosynthesis
MLTGTTEEVTETTSATPTLAIVAICKNEEINLPGFIDSVAGWVDEIVIIDDDSTDNSALIAEAGGPKVRFLWHPMTEEGGYAGQRNAGIDAAYSQWLLHMDCDERPTPELAREILKAIRAKDKDGFRYRRLNYFLHRSVRHGGWNMWNRPQLARRGRHRFTGRLHEECVVDGGGERIGQLKFEMIHLNEASFTDRLRKSGKYVEMTADTLERTGGRIRGLTIALRTAREFLKRYVFQAGFLDGTPGLIIALHAATTEFRVLTLVWDRQNRIPRGELERQIREAWQARGADLRQDGAETGDPT